MSPILSKLFHDGYLDEARSVEQTKVFEDVYKRQGIDRLLLKLVRASYRSIVSR